MVAAAKHVSPEALVKVIAKEFEDFAYIVSHDLNAPLRHVREFTRLFIEARGNQVLSDDEKEYINFLNMSLDKLDSLQNALLDYSRVSTRAGVSQTVDIQSLVKVAISDVCSDRDPDSYKIEYSGLPNVYADPAQTRTVFTQLLDNAVKFHAPGAIPHVRISGEQKGDMVEFIIEDNGIGIDPAQTQEIFKLFRRLHSSDVFPGIGVGLTICKKIIERHGGGIEVKSTSGQGVQVVFLLPVEG